MSSSSQQLPRFRAVFREKAFWGLLLTGLLYFSRPLLLGETFFLREIHSQLLPQRQLLVEQVRQGMLPLWDPNMHGGIPLLGFIGNMVLYPFNLLYAVMPFFFTFNLTIVLHFVLAALATYLLARVSGLHPASSALAGLVYAFCGNTLSFTSLTSAFMAVPYLPLTLMCWHCYWLWKRRRWFVLTAILCLFRVLAGGPELNIIGMVALLGWSLLFPYQAGKTTVASLWKRISAWTLVGALTIGLAAIQIFPTLEMTMLSPRGEILDYTEFAGWSLYWQRVPQMILPNFSGFIDTIVPQIFYWGSTTNPFKGHYVVNIYFGLVAVCLAILGAVLPAPSPDSGLFHRRMRYTLLGVAVAGVMLSFGDFLPGFKWLYRYVPLMGFFRYPIKFLSISVLPIALLAGCAVDGLLTGAQKRGALVSPAGILWIRGMLGAVTMLLVALTAGLLWFDDFARWFQELFFQQSSSIIRSSLQTSLLHACAMWGGFLLIALAGRVRCKARQRWALVALVALDLLVAGRRLNPTASTVFFTDTPPLVGLVRDQREDGRLFRTADPSTMSLEVPSIDIIWQYRLAVELLKGYRATIFQIPTIFHEGFSLAPRRMQNLRETVLARSWEERLPLLSAGAVSLILTPDDVQIDGLRKIAEVTSFSSLSVNVYRNEKYAGRAEFVPRWQYAASEDDALALLLQSDFDPRKTVVLEAPDATLFERPVPMQADPLPPPPEGQSCAPSQVTLDKTSANAQHVSVASACDGYLVLAEPWYPGWKVTVDGEPAPIWRANYAFSAIFLPAGEHQVQRTYRPNSVMLGGLVSAVSGLLLALAAWQRIGI